MTVIGSPLVELGKLLKLAKYRFVSITPASHARLNARMAGVKARSNRDVFGWSRPFDVNLLPPKWFELLTAANAIEPCEGFFKSKVRYSSLGEDLFVHSAFPTVAADSVFFGPDTYRFARFIKAGLSRRPKAAAQTLLDVGAGSGAGGLYARRLLGEDTNVVLSDISPKALDFSRVNAALAGCTQCSFVLSDLFTKLDDADVILANPPYLLDRDKRVYRHGGGTLGFALATRLVAEGLPRLRRGGIMLLYSGSVIVNGVDGFWESVKPHLLGGGIEYTYEELDPDVFGEELDDPAYGAAERVAAVGLSVRKAQ
jgi:release factor glutamine methyltransferase